MVVFPRLTPYWLSKSCVTAAGAARLKRTHPPTSSRHVHHHVSRLPSNACAPELLVSCPGFMQLSPECVRPRPCVPSCALNSYTYAFHHSYSWRIASRHCVALGGHALVHSITSRIKMARKLLRERNSLRMDCTTVIATSMTSFIIGCSRRELKTTSLDLPSQHSRSVVANAFAEKESLAAL